MDIQWGSEIRPFEIQKHLKSSLFELQISTGFKWLGFSYGCKLESQPFENQTIQNLDVFVRISNSF